MRVLVPEYSTFFVFDKFWLTTSSEFGPELKQLGQTLQKSKGLAKLCKTPSTQVAAEAAVEQAEAEAEAGIRSKATAVKSG